VGAIYLYFRSKEDLYVSLLEETFELFDAELKQIRACNDLAYSGRLRAAWSFLCQWAVSDVEGTRTLRLVSQPGVRKQLSDEVAKSTHAGLCTIRDHFTVLITGGIETGEYSTENPEAKADLLWALYTGLLQANDARANLELPGEGFTASANLAFDTVASAFAIPKVVAASTEVAA
jgi:AcrR family transcriptional regulator